MPAHGAASRGVHRVLERLAGDELDGLGCVDLHLRPRCRIAADTRCPGARAEHAESDQLHGFAVDNRRGHGTDDRTLSIRPGTTACRIERRTCDSGTSVGQEVGGAPAVVSPLMSDRCKAHAASTESTPAITPVCCVPDADTRSESPSITRANVARSPPINRFPNAGILHV